MVKLSRCSELRKTAVPVVKKFEFVWQNLHHSSLKKCDITALCFYFKQSKEWPGSCPSSNFSKCDSRMTKTKFPQTQTFYASQETEIYNGLVCTLWTSSLRKTPTKPLCSTCTQFSLRLSVQYYLHWSEWGMVITVGRLSIAHILLPFPTKDMDYGNDFIQHKYFLEWAGFPCHIAMCLIRLIMAFYPLLIQCLEKFTCNMYIC